MKHIITTISYKILLLLCGCAVCYYMYSSIASSPSTSTISEGIYDITGTVKQIRILHKGYTLFLHNTNLKQAASLELRVNTRSALDISVGSVVHLTAIISPYPTAHYPGSYDFRWHAAQQGLDAKGYVISSIRTVAEHKNLQHARYIWMQYFASYPHGDVIIALLFGERKAIHPAILSTIRDSGIAHLLAISGLHVALVCGWLYVLCRLVILCIPLDICRTHAKLYAAGCTLCLGFGYIWLAGMPVSAQRAYIMTGLFLLAVIVMRHNSPLRNIAVAAIIILGWQPYSVLTPGFQMSFAAVTALVALLVPYWQSYHASYHVLARLQRFVTTTCLSSFIAGFATMPFVIYHFNNMASYGLLANLIAVPLTSLWVMPLGVLSLLLYPFSLASLALYPMGWGIDVLLDIADFISHLPAATHNIPSMHPFVLVLIVIIGLWGLLSAYSYRLYLAIPAIMCLSLSGYLRSYPHIILHHDSIGRFAVRYPDGVIAYSTPPPSRFIRHIWEEKTASIVSDDNTRLHCDDMGCITIIQHKQIAFLYHPSAFAEACSHADIVINFTYHPYYCHSPQRIVLRYDLWKRQTPLLMYVD